MKLLKDLRFLRDAVPAALALRHIKADKQELVPDFVERIVDEHRDRPAFFFEDEVLSYGEFDALANRVANHFSSEGVVAGDVVALDMENRPIFVAIWMGLAKIGATTALINTNLRGPQLSHCLEVAEPKHLIVGAELAENFGDVDGLAGTKRWSQGGAIEGHDDLDAALAGASDLRPSRSARAGLTLGDTKLFYIYTSGTTGLPKAAHFSHLRYMTTSIGASAGMKITPDDRQYICLPLYHTAGGIMALGGALTSGAASVIVPKFSASRFWTDAVRYKVTTFQYIGELMRYLVNSAPTPEERQHAIRACMGNGLRPEVWPQVVERFGISNIYEFYGATEGNVAFVNLDGKQGSIGRTPAMLRKLAGITLLKYDVDADEVVRGPDGFCIEVGPGEPGEAVGRIPDKGGSATGRFEGYSDEKATEKKILRDVFKKGDAYFRTGDLLRFDDEDYFYFVDRIGDTFRWKGENVATTEIAEVISVLPDVAEANVYGVEIPGTDGRAGMAAIVADGGSLDLDRLFKATEADLASYARPLFIRHQPEMEITGTFKHRKVDLVKDGFDPTKTSDPLYFRDNQAGAYVPIDAALYAKLIGGEIRL